MPARLRLEKALQPVYGEAWVPGVQVGAPFQVSLRLRNRTHRLQALTLRLGDTTGFVLAGAWASRPLFLQLRAGSTLHYMVTLHQWCL